MALKPPPIGDFVQQLNNMLAGSSLKTEVDKNLRPLVQSALARLDVVSREEFDSQTEVLHRTRAKVDQLEQELAQLTQQLEDEQQA